MTMIRSLPCFHQIVPHISRFGSLSNLWITKIIGYIESGPKMTPFSFSAVAWLQRKVWWYQRGNQKPSIEEGQKEKGQTLIYTKHYAES